MKSAQAQRRAFLSPTGRLLCSLALLIPGAMMLGHDISSGWALIGLGLLPLWGYFRTSSVRLAFRSFQEGDLEQARRWLSQVPWPPALSAKRRAYYEWLRGAFYAVDGQFGTAREHLLIAAAGPIETDNDRSLIQCLLAEVALLSGDAELARGHLARARALPHRTPVDGLIDRMEARLPPVRGSAGESGVPG